MEAVFQNSSFRNPLSGLAHALLQTGRLSTEQVEALHKKSSSDQTPLIVAVLKSGYLDAGDLAPP